MKNPDKRLAAATANIQSYNARRQKLKEQNQTVTTPIGRVGNETLKATSLRNKGRRKFTPARLRNAINKYFDWCEETDNIPSIKGLVLHLNVTRDFFYRNLRDEQYTEILEQARLVISEWAERDVYNTKGMASGKIAYMKNVHGWAEKLESQNYTEQRVITVEEARAKIQMLAPNLLEVLKSSTVVNQIARQDAEAPE